MTDQPDLPHPPMFRYEDGNEIISEIYVAPGRHEEIKQLWETEQWNELAKFPRWSDRPPLPPRQPDSMTYTTPEGKERSIWLPEGSHGRVYELFKSEDWEGLERGFVQYTGQQREVTEEEREYYRGVGRMRKEREEKRLQKRET